MADTSGVSRFRRSRQTATPLRAVVAPAPVLDETPPIQAAAFALLEEVDRELARAREAAAIIDGGPQTHAHVADALRLRREAEARIEGEGPVTVLAAVGARDRLHEAQRQLDLAVESAERAEAATRRAAEDAAVRAAEERRYAHERRAESAPTGRVDLRPEATPVAPSPGPPRSAPVAEPAAPAHR